MKDIMRTFSALLNESDLMLELYRSHLSQDEFLDLKLISNLNQPYSLKPPSKFYQSGIILGRDFQERIVYLPKEQIKRHLAILGKTRSGKTTLVLNLFHQLFLKNQAKLVVIDKGDLVDKILCLVDHREEDIILLKISDTSYPVSINLLRLTDFQPQLVINETIRMVNLLSQEKLSDRMALLFRRALRALLNFPEATLLDLEPFFFNEDFRRKILSRLNDPELSYFWKERYPKEEKVYRSSAEGILSRLEPIIGNPEVRNLLCQKETKIPIKELVLERQNLVLLLDLNSQGKISPLVGEVIARIFLIIITSLALSRTFEKQVPIYLFLDEVQTYLEPYSLAEILSRGAKYGIHLILAFQYLDQLGELWKAVEGNVGSIFSFTTGADDAYKLAKSFPNSTPKDFVELARFQILARINDEQGTYCFKLKTLPPLATTRSSKQKIINLCRERYARKKAEVEEEIRKHKERLMEKAQEDMPKKEQKVLLRSLDPII